MNGLLAGATRATVRLPRLEQGLRSFWGWRHRDRALLGLIVVSITALNMVWVALDSGRLYVDHARHLGDSLFYKETFSLADPIQYLEGYVYYPPFMYWVTDVFYAVLGTDFWVAIFSNVVFIAILVFSTYGIGKALWNPRVGLLAALFTVTTPLFVSQFKEYMLDAPLSAMVAAALYFLIRSEAFLNRRASLLFGVACGCGLLVKWSFPSFLALPVAAVLVTALVSARREQSATRLLNFASAGLLTLGLCALWYLPNFAEFRADADYYAGLPSSIQGTPPVGSLAAALWYFWSLVNTGLYLVPFLFFAAGVVYLFRRREFANRNSLLVLSLIGSYIALSLISLKDFRYVMPMIPAIAVIGTSWLEYLRPKPRQWLSRGLIAYSTLAFLIISFGAGLLPRDIRVPLEKRSFTSGLYDLAPPESYGITGIVIFGQHGFRIGAPSEEEWHQEDVFEEMARRGGEATFWFAEPGEAIWFNTWGVRYYEAKHDALWVTSPDQARFLIIRGPVPPGVTGGFVQVKRYRLPYGGPLRLYERV